MKRPELPNSEAVWILSLGDCGETTDWTGLLKIQSSIHSSDGSFPFSHSVDAVTAELPPHQVVM